MGCTFCRWGRWFGSWGGGRLSEGRGGGQRTNSRLLRLDILGSNTSLVEHHHGQERTYLSDPGNGDHSHLYSIYTAKTGTHTRTYRYISTTISFTLSQLRHVKIPYINRHFFVSFTSPFHYLYSHAWFAG